MKFVKLSKMYIHQILSRLMTTWPCEYFFKLLYTLFLGSEMKADRRRHLKTVVSLKKIDFFKRS